MSKEAHKRKNKRVFTERNVLAEARSTWIVELFATFQDRDYVFMAMEFGQGGDLRGHLQRREPGNGEYGRFTHDEVVFYTAELLEALDTVHKCGFVHRDIKPDNIVLTREGHLKLLDFGLCIGNADQQDLCGSPPYLAAEAFEGPGAFSPASDLWALGVVAFECLYGRPLWPPPRELSNQGPAAFRWLKENVIVRYEHYLRTNLKSAERKGLLTSELRRLFERLICPRGNRLRADALRREPLFRCLDFGALHEVEPPIRPALSGPDDTSMFPQCPDRRLPSPYSGPGVDPALSWSWYELDGESHHMSRPDVLRDRLRRSGHGGA
ncbi:unnamed protein product [Prorocentrum cordatum]|nr:unnamed protein product [Polarella glacialis]